MESSGYGKVLPRTPGGKGGIDGSDHVSSRYHAFRRDPPARRQTRWHWSDFVLWLSCSFVRLRKGRRLHVASTFEAKKMWMKDGKMMRMDCIAIGAIHFFAATR